MCASCLIAFWLMQFCLFFFPERINIFGRNGFGDYTGKVERRRTFQWILLSGQAGTFHDLRTKFVLSRGVYFLMHCIL